MFAKSEFKISVFTGLLLSFVLYGSLVQAERIKDIVDIKGIRSNPFHSLKDIKKGKLSFDPNRYMVDSRDMWMTGGYDAPASELIIDLRALLASDHLSTPEASIKPTTAPSSRTSSTPEPPTDSEVGKLKEEISNLKSELSRLQDLIIQKAE